MQLSKLKELIETKKIRWTIHCLEKMQERDISIEDVKNCILNGEIIEEYPEDFPYPSCLIFGQSLDDRIIHVVAGTDEEKLYIITTYIPNISKFNKDMKTRRE